MNVLVVAFDGLDKELIEEYGIDGVKQEEFGGIDNSTGMKSIKTSELFASFITGETHEEHGVEGLKKEHKGGEPLFDRIHHSIPQGIKDRLNTDRMQRLFRRVQPSSSIYTREDIQSETLFDTVPGAEDINIPVYSENTFLERKFVGFELGFGRDTVRRDLEAEHAYRRKETFDAVEDGGRFVMSHFFYPDTFHHLYHPKYEDKVKAMYHRMGDLAEEIVAAAEDRFDAIILMSDHGLPTKDAHNENAFYSSNIDLFPDRTPSITDFHDRIMELTDATAVEDVDV